MNAHRGFSLLEMLVCIAILAIAVFPLLLIKEQAIVDATDAKLALISRSHIQRLLSEAALDLDFRDVRSGDLGEYGYRDITWSVECTAIDLSTEVEDSSDRDRDRRDGEDWRREDSLFDELDGKTEDDGELFRENDEETLEDDIDERFKFRHIRLTISYPLGFGDDAETRKVFAETYLPPLPKEDGLFSDFGRSDLVLPNDGKN